MPPPGRERRQTSAFLSASIEPDWKRQSFLTLRARSLSKFIEGAGVHRRIVEVLFACFCLGELTLQAQKFSLLGRELEIHGFASQGFVYTNTNNWLTMNSSQGSAAFTDFGFNASSNITDKLRVGAQLYDRNLGQLGQYHSSLDWAVADYRFKSWLGFRGGKVKTTLGLYTDSQDLDFLRTFALLPQSAYPTDLRDATIAHLGGDIYGNVYLNHRLGDLSYTFYAGHRSDSIYSGIAYVVTEYGVHFLSYGGLQYGGDLRWNTPLKRLLIGISRLSEDITNKGTFTNPFNPAAGVFPTPRFRRRIRSTNSTVSTSFGKCGSIQNIAAFCTINPPITDFS
jgi:hypothetical protein